MVKPQTRDRCGRTVARINFDGTDANTEMTRTGAASVFGRCVTDRGLCKVEDEARTALRGLWGDRDAMPPWMWRKHQ